MPTPETEDVDAAVDRKNRTLPEWVRVCGGNAHLFRGGISWFTPASGDRRDLPVTVADGIWRRGPGEHKRVAGRGRGRERLRACGGTKCFR
jgi:hypothetical protein